MLRQQVYPGVPTLSWTIAKRITNKHAATDCTVCIEGKKGSGKSTLTLALAEAVSKDIAMLAGGKPEDYFDPSHVVSVEQNGAIELLTSGKLKKKHSVFILDDVSVQWNSRRSMTIMNQLLNDILTISRVYECVIFCNLVARGASDLVLRQLTDFVIRIHSKSTVTGQSLFKCFYLDVKPDGKELFKYLTWKGPDGKIRRIKWWIGGLPSAELNAQYKELRIRKTDEHIDKSYQKFQEKVLGNKTQKKAKSPLDNPTIVAYKDKVAEMYKAKFTTEDIVRETGLTRYWVQKCKAAADGKLGAV